MSISGCMYKKGRIIKSNLKKRYFQLVGQRLYFYASKAVAAKGVGAAKGSELLTGLQSARIGGLDKALQMVSIHLVLANNEKCVYYLNWDREEMRQYTSRTSDNAAAEVAIVKNCGAQRWVDAFIKLIPKKIKSVIQGHLQHSTDQGKTWKERYVMLLSEELVIFDSEESSRSADPLASALQRLRFTDDFFVADAASKFKASGGGKGKHPYSFQVCDLGETSYYLAAPDAQFKMFWMMAISKIIEAIMAEAIEISRNSFNGATVIGVNPLQAAEELEEKNKRDISRQLTVDLQDNQRGRLLYNFEAENDGEISIPQHEICILIEKVDDDFWICQYGSHRGFVQSDYLEMIQPPSKKAPPPPQRSKRHNAPPVPNRANKPSTVETSIETSMDKNDSIQRSQSKPTPRGSIHPGAPPPLFESKPFIQELNRTGTKETKSTYTKYEKEPTKSNNSNNVFSTRQFYNKYGDAKEGSDLGNRPNNPPPPVPNRSNKPKPLEKKSSVSRMAKIKALSEKRKAVEKKEKEAKLAKEQLQLEEEQRKQNEMKNRRKSMFRMKQEQEKLKKEQQELELIKKEEKKIEERKQKQKRQSMERKELEKEKLRLEKERKAKELKLKQHQQKLKLEQEKEEKRKKLKEKENSKIKIKEEKLKKELKIKQDKAHVESMRLKKEQEQLKKDIRIEKAAKKIQDAQIKAVSKSKPTITPRRSSMSLGKNKKMPKIVQNSTSSSSSSSETKNNAPSRKSTRRTKGGGKGKGGGIAARMAMWNKKANDYKDSQEKNVFSDKYKGGGGIPKKGDANYGKAIAGSATEKRAQAAKAWVVKEMAKLVEVIEENGIVGEHNCKSITFGELFVLYQDISDTLVGILMRAKKYKKLFYKGQMLFQGMHNAVVIQLLPQ